MSFYTSISDHYRKIFPLNPAQSRFVNNCFADSRELFLLDIGCGTGDLSLELAKSFKKVVGIDMDESMLKDAIKDAGTRNNVDFHCLNMLDILSRYGPGAFDAILCFGNILVHLESLKEISGFFSQINKMLRPGGKLLLQIINYDRILDGNIDSLPTIDTDQINFLRNYHYVKKIHQIDFETILTIKSTKQIIHNRIQLFPVRKREIEKALREAGFIATNFFGNFKGDPLGSESLPLVIEARVD